LRVHAPHVAEREDSHEVGAEQEEGVEPDRADRPHAVQSRFGQQRDRAVDPPSPVPRRAAARLEA
jgi:hypothetical protein